jgi:hypothetical protein
MPKYEIYGVLNVQTLAADGTVSCTPQPCSPAAAKLKRFVHLYLRDVLYASTKESPGEKCHDRV